jgi:hypothetical protein
LEGSYEDYYAKKLAAFKMVPKLTEDDKVQSIKKGFDEDTSVLTIGIKKLTDLCDYCIERDRIRSKTQKNTPEIIAMQPQKQRSRRFQGNCNWCRIYGHKEIDCRKKKNGIPRVIQANNSARIAQANLNVLQESDCNKDTLHYERTENIFTLVTTMPWSHICIQSRILSGYWDSGASISAIDENFFRAHFSSVSVNNRDLPNIRMANSEILKPLGSVELLVRFDGLLEKFVKKIKFYIIPNLPKPCILGMNVMRYGTFSFTDGEASFDNYKFKLYRDSSDSVSVFSAAKVTLPPDEPVEIRVKVEGSKTYLVKPDPNSTLYWVDGRGVCNSTEWIYVINQSSRPVTIAKGELLNVPIFDEESFFFVDMAKMSPVDRQSDDNDIDISPDAPKEAKELLLMKIKEVKEKLNSREWGTNALSHKLKLKEEFVNRCNAYVYGPKESDFISASTKEMLDRKICRPSNAINVSPVVVAKHPRTGKLRFCVNYQKLNSVTRREEIKMPKVWDILKKLIGSDWFSTMDLQSGFWQVPMDDDSIPLTAFITNEGIFEMLFMPFGLLNASFTFQEMMNKIMYGSAALPYVDDCPVHSKGDATTHVKAVADVLDRLVENNLRPNWSKCKFLYRRLELLGHIVSHGKIEVNPNRLNRLLEMPDPTKVKEVLMFLGLCNVYYKFIPNFQIVAEPLFNLTRKGVPWSWTHDCIDACKELKNLLINAVFIGEPIPGLPFHVSVDSSEHAAGWSVYQIVDGSDKQHVLGFGGKTYNKGQRGYAPGQQELLAILLALEDYRWCLHGQEIFVHSDHKAWSWIMNLKKIPARTVAHWIMELMDYNPSIEWIPGKFNKVADALTRLWKKEDFLLLDCNHLPEEKKLDIIRKVHSDDVWGSHGQFQNTLKKLSSRFSWKGMRGDVKKVVENCRECKVNRVSKRKAPMTPIIANKPFNIVGIDIVGPFTESKMHPYRYVIIIVDYFTKWIELFATKEQDAESIIPAVNNILKRFNTPQLLISDGGALFTKSVAWKSFLRSINCNADNSAVYHQQANGQTERYVQEVKPLIRIKCENNIDRWPSTLADVMASLNSSHKYTTGMSAFKALLGYEPTLPVEREYAGHMPETADRHKAILDSTIVSKKSQSAAYNNNLTAKIYYDIGDDVFVKKFKRKGSVDVANVAGKIVEIRGPDSYVVSSSQGIQNVNASHLQPMVDPLMHVDSTSPAANYSSEANKVSVDANPSSAVKNLSKSLSKDPLIGRRISVWWDDYAQHYSGTIARSDDKRKGSHIVHYDDGVDVYENLEAKKNRQQVEFEELNDSKRISKIIQYKLDDTMDEDENSEEDEDFVANSSSIDTDFSDAEDIDTS